MNAPFVPAHSPFGGSVAARVLRCPASVGLIEKIPAYLRKVSAYAERGTALHTAMALLIDNARSLDGLVGDIIGGYAIAHDDVEKIAADFGTVAMTVADADMPDLPPINVVVTPLALPDAVMATYKTMQQELFAEIEGRGIEAASPLIATGKLAQLANGFLYDAGAGDPVFVHSAKIDWLCDLVESLDGEPLLIAYEFVEDLRTIRRAFGEVPALGGQTGAREASRLVADWNEGKLPLLAFHPASAGHGLNLQHGGSRMAWLSPSWSAELTEQAIARIYRPGQTQHVTIHVCVAAGSIDEMKRDRVIGKMSAQEAFRRHLERV